MERRSTKKLTAASSDITMSLTEEETKMPSLETNQQMLEVILDTKVPISTTAAGAEKVISSAVAEVVDAATAMKDVTPESAHGSGEATENTVLESAECQNGRSDTVAGLWKWDDWVDPFLPLTDEDQDQLTSSLEAFEAIAAEISAEQQGEPKSYCECLGRLSGKVCLHLLNKMKETAQSIQNALFHLKITLDLIEYSKRKADQKHPDVQEDLNKMWLQWSLEELEMNERERLLQPGPMESRILLVSHFIMQHLQADCLSLHSNIQGFPEQVQEQVLQLQSIFGYIHAYLYTAASFQDIPGSILEPSKLKILEARLVLHGLLDYMIENVVLTQPADPLASTEGSAEGVQVMEEANQPSSLQSK